MFLYENNFSFLKIFGGARAPPGPHGHDATELNSNILFAVLTAFVHCLLTFKSSWTMPPKSRSSETLDNSLPKRQYFACCYLFPIHGIYLYLIDHLYLQYCSRLATAAAFVGTTVRQVSLRRTVSSHRYEEVVQDRKLVVKKTARAEKWPGN